jgi:Ig-like domain-containing protein
MKKLFLFLALFAGARLFSQAADVAKTYTVGDPFSLSFVSATGTAPFTYQWQKDGVDIPGATGPTISTAALPLAAAGVYTLTVKNSAGQTVSNKAVVTVVPSVVPPGSAVINFGK